MFDYLNPYSSVPYSMDAITRIQSSYTPSAVCTDSATKEYYKRCLTQRLMSLFEPYGLPDTWDKAYLMYALAFNGYVGVIDTSKASDSCFSRKDGDYGVIPQICTLKGYGIYNQPTGIVVSSPFFNYTGTIHKDCEVIRFSPDYGGVADIVEFYATKLSYATKALDMSMANSCISWVMAAKNKAAAQVLKNIVDQVQSGNPAVIYDASTLAADDNKSADPTPWQTFTRDVKLSYISTEVLDNIRTIFNMFDTEVGIPNANITKRERMSVDEVNANNVETRSRATVWLDSLNTTAAYVNKMYGLNIGFGFSDTEEGDEQDESENELDGVVSI